MTIFLLASCAFCMTQEEMDHLRDAVMEQSEVLNHPMNAVQQDLFDQLMTLPLFNTYLHNIGGLIAHDEISFTFSAVYILRPESKIRADVRVDAEVRVMFEQALQDPFDNYRTDHAINLADITCNKLQNFEDQRFYSYSLKSEDTDTIGLHTGQGLPYSSYMQKFYEQYTNNMTITVGDEAQELLISVSVMELVSRNLATPLANIVDSPSAAARMNLLLKILVAGESLYGNKMLHGDLSLESFGYVIKTMKGDEEEYHEVHPRMILSDDLVNMWVNNKEKENFVDTIARNHGDYRAPWLVPDGDGNYTYSWDLKEDAYAFLILMEKYAQLNGISGNLVFKGIMRAIKNDYNVDMSNMATIPDPDQLEITARQVFDKTALKGKHLII